MSKEKAPVTLAEMSPEQLRSRLHEINQEITGLTSGINAIPAAFEESGQGDDNAVESESTQQAFGLTQERLAHLRRELLKVEERITKTEKKAA